MSEPQVPFDPELTSVENALGALAPSRSRLDRDRLMFRAGQVSPRPTALGRFGWPAVAASLAVVVVGQGVALGVRPSTRVVERVVVVRVPTPPLETPAVPAPVVILRQSPQESPDPSMPLPWPDRYERLRNRVVQFGLDGLPDPPSIAAYSGGRPAVAGSEASGALLRSEIARLLNPGEAL